MTRLLATALVLSILALSTPPASADKGMIASQMLNYFSAGCPTQGEWTRAALSQAQSLTDVMRSVQNDPDCVTVSGSISQLSSLSGRIAKLQFGDQRQILGLKQQEQELLLQLSAVDPNGLDASMIKTQLRSVKLELAQLTGYRQFDTIHDTEVADTMSALVSNTNAFLQQAIANNSCIVKHPSLLPGIASLTGTVAAAAYTSGISLGIMAGVDLLAITLENVRHWRVQRRINKSSESLVSSAYQCVLESLSNQWCSAEDALSIVRTKGAARPEISKDHPLLHGMRLLDRDLPVVLRWLDQVRAGADATSQAMADRQTKALEREKMVRTTRAQGMGIIEENRILFELIHSDSPSKNDRDRWIIEKNTVRDLLAKINGGNGFMSGPQITHPMLEVYAQDYAPYFLLGLTLQQAPKFVAGGSAIIKPIDQFDPFVEWQGIVGQPFRPDLNIVRAQLLLWVQNAQDRVNNELSIVLNPDPLEILNKAAAKDQHGFAPYDSLGALAAFLKDQAPKSYVVGSHKRLYLDTIARVEDIAASIRTIVEPVTPLPEDPNDPGHPKNILGRIYKQAALDFGTVLLENRLETSIRLALTELLTSGTSGLDSETAAKLLASDDVLRELKRYAGTDDLNLIARDIEKSQALTVTTFSSFIDLFGKGISKNLKHYKKTGGTVQLKEQAEMCLKLLAAPKWPKNVSKKICEGMQLPSLFVGGPASIVVNETAMNLPYEKRACAHRNFLRANRIFQNYRDKQPLPR